MAGKSTSGFTKTAQKTKFIRNRDIKLKGSEIKNEQKIQRLMCEGVCRRCREKVQWRFKYDKYKSLKVPGTCSECKKKTITKAYRTLCDACATVKKCCAGCCGDIEADEGEADGKEVSSRIVAEDTDDMMVASSSITETSLSADTVNCAIPANVTACVALSSATSSTSVWDERKFTSIATQKYSKDRVVGKEDEVDVSMMGDDIA